MKTNLIPRRPAVPSAITPTTKESNSTSEVKSLIGVDFGTTFSGMAYVETLNPTQSFAITKWGPGTPTGDQAPTVLAYENEGITEPFRWGFQVRSGVRRHEWFKLGLEPTVQFRNYELADEYPNSTAYPPVSAKDSEKSVIAYLSSLKNRAEAYLTETFGGNFVQEMPMEYIITVLAVWTDKAQFKMRSYAERAGMGERDKIQIISEPEAARMYAVESMSTLGLGMNDTFVVCDAGGG